jgi:chromate transporter
MRHEQAKQTIQFAAAALAVGLILASAWQIALQINTNWVAYALTIGAALIATVTRWHPMYLILIGAVLGLLGLI